MDATRVDISEVFNVFVRERYSPKEKHLPISERTTTSYNVIADFGKLPNGKDYKESVGGFKKKKDARNKAKEVTASIENKTYSKKYGTKRTKLRRKDAANNFLKEFYKTREQKFKILAQLLNPPLEPIINEDLTVGDCFDAWLSSSDSYEHVQPSTLADYTSVIRQHLKPDLGALPVSEFTAQDFKNYISYKKNPIQFTFGKKWADRLQKQIERAKAQNLDKKEYNQRKKRIHTSINKLLKQTSPTNNSSIFFIKFDIPSDSRKDGTGKKTRIEQFGYRAAPHYSLRTLKGFRIVLNMVFDWAVEHENYPINKNPIPKSKRHGTKTKKDRLSKKEIQYWEPTQIKLFFKELDSIYWEGGYHRKGIHWLREVFYLAIKSGLRRSELSGLQWKYFNDEDGTIEVKEVATFGSKYKDLKLTLPKTEESERIIKLDSSTLKRLEEWRIKQDSLLNSLGLEASTFIFTKIDTGGMIHPQTLGQSFQTTLGKIRTVAKTRKLDLPEITLHGSWL